MKINLLLLFLLSVSVLVSCSQRTTMDTHKIASTFVLSAFNDMTTRSTFNEEELASYPVVVNFSDKMTPPKNQGERGTCTFFAATGLIEAALKIDKGIETNLSEEFMIFSTKQQGYFEDIEASQISVNLEAAKVGGILLEKDWSYMPSWFAKDRPCAGMDDESEETAIECFVHQPTNKTLEKVIPAGSIKTGFMRKNTNAIIKFLATNQRPLAISLPVNYKGWSDSGDVIYNEELRQTCLYSPTACAAHSVLLTGYNRQEKVFYFKNSWGQDWGNQGFGKVSFEAVDRYVDGYLYYTKIDGNINIPADANVDNFKFENLAVNPHMSSRIDVETFVKATNAEGRFIELKHYLALRFISTEIDSTLPFFDADSDYITLTNSSSQLDFTGQQITAASFPEETLGLPNLQEGFSNPLYEPIIITTALLYTDSSTEPIVLSKTIAPIKR